MIILIICLFCLINLLVLFPSKRYYNPLFIYLIFWMFILAASYLHLNGLFVVRDSVYWMFFGGIVTFTIACAVTSKIPVSLSEPFADEEIQYKIRYNVVFFFLLLSLAFLLWRMVPVVQGLLNGNSARVIRDMFYEYSTEDQSSRYLFYFQTFVITPVIYAAAVTIVMDMMMGKRCLLMTFLTIFTTATFILVSGGGRVVILNYIFHVVFTYMMLEKKQEISPSVRNKLIFLIIGLVIIFLGVNVFRGKGNAILALLDEAYKYYAGSVQHFQVRIDCLGVIRDHGIAFFAGYLRPFFLGLSLIGIKAPECYNVFLAQNALLQKGIQIGSYVWYNAYATMNFHFYLSFGAFGILLGNFMYGIICGSSYSAYQKRANYWTIGVLLLILQGILTSMIRWQFSISTYALSFIFLRMFLGKCIVTKKKD